MDSVEYCWAAADIVIRYAKECGINYRRGDFFLSTEHISNIEYSNNLFKNELAVVGERAGIPEGVTVYLFFGYERCGKTLKQYRERFFNYANARVINTGPAAGVVFSFSIKELDFIALKSQDENDNNIDKIIITINKLFALADLDKNPSEAEAIAASLKAQQLMAKYGLDITDVSDEGNKRQSENIEQVIADIGEGQNWKYGLANIIADNYRCRYYLIGSSSICFYGYKSDAIIARRVFIYLFSVGKRLASQYVKEQKSLSKHANGLYNSFCGGFCNGVKIELTKNSRALMLTVSDIVNKKFTDFSKNFKEVKKGISINDRMAYSQGRVEGKRALSAHYIEG